MGNIEYIIKLNWNKYLKEKFKTKGNLFSLFNDSYYIKNLINNNCFFGCICEAKFYLNEFNYHNYDVFKINMDNIGFRIKKLYYNPTKEDEIYITIEAVNPLGHYVRKEIFDIYDMVLHPRVPNLGTKEEPKFIPVTFDLIFSFKLMDDEEELDRYRGDIFSKLEYKTVLIS